jgi:hypothetical protein
MTTHLQSFQIWMDAFFNTVKANFLTILSKMKNNCQVKLKITKHYRAQNVIKSVI